MDTDRLLAANLETARFQLIDHPTQWTRGIGTWEDILAHEETPVEVLELPVTTKTGNLEVEDTIVMQHLANLTHEGWIVLDTDMLRHLETSDLVEDDTGGLLVGWNITVIHADGLSILDTLVLGSGSLVSGLIATESDTIRGGTVLLSTLADGEKESKGSEQKGKK